MYIPIQWWLVISSRVYFLLPREFPQPQRSPFPAPVPLLFVVITASPREWWFLPCQQFLDLLSFHIQDVSFRKHEPTPPPVWLLFALIRLQWTNFYLLAVLGQIKHWKKWARLHFCVCSSHSFYSVCWPRRGSASERKWICSSKLPGSFPGESGQRRKALFSYSEGLNRCSVILVWAPTALFTDLAASECSVCSPATEVGWFLIHSEEGCKCTQDLPCWENPQRSHLPQLWATTASTVLDKKGVAAEGNVIGLVPLVPSHKVCW